MPVPRVSAPRRRERDTDNCTTPDITTPDRDTSACRLPTKERSPCLRSIWRHCDTEDSAYRLQRTCGDAAAEVVGLVFVQWRLEVRQDRNPCRNRIINRRR